MPKDPDQAVKVQVLLAEYTATRAETNARVSSAYTIIAAGTLLVVFIIQHPTGCPFWIGLFLVIFGIAYCGRMLAFDARNASRRTREIELEINRRLDEKLLLWETERGGLTPDYWKKAWFLKKSD